ncbi:hypothetical protein CHS0354_031562 [Potamilus streckersoni]|uniref:Uncharacterized protein n=1 Tax=Potamilus streckersoni TaxID=2493646 RepID=A0AAE0SZL3_9BIVA|nr:hypothetical protein CHS0354_031562 [Potamilus streckersoni]
MNEFDINIYRCSRNLRNHYCKHRYHADTDHAQKKSDFNDVNNAFNDIDIVISNHTLEAGVSITDDRFRVMYVFSEELGSVEATKQALHIFRCVDEIYYSAPRKQRTSFTRDKLPINHESIEKIIIDIIERLIDDVTKLCRIPSAGELKTAFGFAYISDIIDENNSKMYFTSRIIHMMRSTGYQIIDDYDTWTQKNIEKPAAEITKNPIVDKFLKSSVGERIQQTHAEKTDQNEEYTRYYKYYEHNSQNKYEAKQSHLNHLYQCDVGKLPAEQVEHPYKNSTNMRRSQRVIVDKLHQGRAIETEVFRSDKLSPKEKLAKIRKLLTLLNLPDIVPDNLLAKTTPISGSDLGMYIEDMINHPDLLQHYNDPLSNWSSIIPESRIKLTKTNRT